MKTCNLFFLLIVVIFGGVAKGRAQGMVNQTTYYFSTARSGGYYNANFGHLAGSNSTDGNNNNNTNIGHSAGTSNVSGYENTFLGYTSGTSNVAGRFNVLLGSQAGRNSNADFNVFIGARCGLANTSGYDNVFIGYQSGLVNQSGNFNSYLGRSAGANNPSGSENTFVGYASGYGSTGSQNTFLGRNSGYWSTGSNNVYLGNYAGNGASGSGTGSNNVFLGNNVGRSYSFANQSNLLLIDNSDVPDPMIRGDFSTENILFNVNQSATSGVEINSGVNNSSLNGTSGLRFSNMKITTNAVANLASPPKVLSLNANGDVILVNDAGGATVITGGGTTTVTGNGTTATPYVINSCNLYSCDGAIDGSTTYNNIRTVKMDKSNIVFQTGDTRFGKIYIGKTPNFPTVNANYKLYVEDGILTEKVRVALRFSTDWQDHVFNADHILMPLKDVETFVKSNKHLPGIESADELVAKGIDLGAMQSQQMGKIEELTLYVIEQNKALEKQNKEIEELKAQVKILLERK